MFGVAIHIVLKMAIKRNYVLQKIFINSYKPQFQAGSTKNPNIDEKCKKLHHFGLKNS